ncbi:hypothetical protein J6590_097071 [Homalodisca vitripennis]|nr:hypothetical protein J6590_097071 [Homalodisca vitripennis]
MTGLRLWGVMGGMRGDRSADCAASAPPRVTFARAGTPSELPLQHSNMTVAGNLLWYRLYFWTL